MTVIATRINDRDDLFLAFDYDENSHHTLRPMMIKFGKILIFSVALLEIVLMYGLKW